MRDNGTVDLFKKFLFINALTLIIHPAYSQDNIPSPVHGGASVNYHDQQYNTATDGTAVLVVTDPRSQLTGTKLEIDTYATGDHGAKVVNSGTLVLRRSRIGIHGSGGNGIEANNGVVAILNSTDITTDGSGSDAIALSGSTLLHIDGGSRVVTEGNRSDGIQAGLDTTVNGNNVNITTRGEESFAIETEGRANFTGSTLTTEGNRSHVVRLESSRVAPRGRELSFTDSTLTATGDGASVIYATGDANTASTVSITDSHLSSTHGNLIEARGTYLNLIFGGNNQFNVPNGHLLYVAKNAANKASNVNVLLDNAPLLTGDMVAEDLASILNITLQNHSAWKGSGRNVNKVTMEGGSAWHLSSDSDVTDLEMQPGSYVNFVNRHDQYNTLTIRNNLAGDGAVFRMHVSMEKQQGDQLQVHGRISGQHTLAIDNNAAENTLGTEVHTVAVADHAGGGFKLEHLVEDGGYLYDLRKESSEAGTRAGGNERWELYGIQKVTPVSNAAVSFISAAYLMQYAENQTLLQRMDNLHYGTQDNRIWGRGFVGRFDHFSSGKLEGFSMNYHGFQVGGDHKLEQAYGNLFLGLFVSLGNSTQQQRPSDGNLSSRSLGLYASYLDNSQFYLDSWLKAGSMSNEFNVFDTAGTKVHGKADINNVSVSLEMGQRFYLSNTSQGWYLEPQLQYTLAHQGSSSVTASNGLYIKTDSMNFSLGRGSLLAGYQFDNVELYVKSGYLHEFNGNVNYYLNNSTEKQHYKSGWWNNGIGIMATVAKKHTFYLDLDSSTGRGFNQRQANMGYRFSF